MTSISLKLAWRETTNSWSRFIFLFLCIALGVGAIVAVDLFATNVEQAILGDARGLLGGDIELSWRRTMSQNGQDVLDSISKRKIIVSHITELAAMAAVESAQPHDQTTKATSQLVELKALDSFYPLYGNLMVEPAQTTKQLLAPIPSGCQRLPM
jgi:putative ABC transport system permease protein